MSQMKKLDLSTVELLPEGSTSSDWKEYVDDGFMIHQSDLNRSGDVWYTQPDKYLTWEEEESRGSGHHYDHHWSIRETKDGTLYPQRHWRDLHDSRSRRYVEYHLRDDDLTDLYWDREDDHV